MYSEKMGGGVRIILCGASSVGKTTLAKEWRATNTDFLYISEVARNVMRKHSFTTEGLKDSLKTEEKKDFLKLQQLIIEEQNRIELSYITTNPECSFVSDRGPDPIVYALYYAGPEACLQLESNPAAQACLERYKRCLVAVICPLKTITEDGVRLTLDEDGAQKFTDTLCGLLEKHGVPYLYIDKTDRRERVHLLEQAVKDFKQKEASVK